jgi:hypothetical protein
VVTRKFNNISDREQKERLLHCLFEESEVRRIAEELRFDLHEFSAIRSQYNQKRSILKGPKPTRP